jgi:hypothetical protein
VRKHFPFVRRDFLAINRDDDALAAEFFRAGADEIGFVKAEELMLVLSAPARSIVYMSSDRPDATTDGKRHEALIRRALDYATIVPRPCAVAVMSKKTISSAPCSL